MTCKICTPLDYTDLYNLYNQHSKVGKRVLDYRMNFEEFVLKLDGTVVFGFYQDDKLETYMVTSVSQILPMWFMLLVMHKRTTTKFDARQNGIPQLYDTAIKYWEGQDINQFMFWGPVSYGKSADVSVRENSIELQRYITTTLTVVKRNTLSEYKLLNILLKGLTYPTDTIFKISSRNDRPN